MLFKTPVELFLAVLAIAFLLWLIYRSLIKLNGHFKKFFNTFSWPPPTTDIVAIEKIHVNQSAPNDNYFAFKYRLINKNTGEPIDGFYASFVTKPNPPFTSIPVTVEGTEGPITNCVADVFIHNFPYYGNYTSPIHLIQIPKTPQPLQYKIRVRHEYLASKPKKPKTIQDPRM